MELSAGAGRAVWLRYTLRDGPGGGCSVWCVRTSPDGIDGHHVEVPLDRLSPNGIFDLGEHGRIEPDRVQGAAGPYSWDLRLRSRGRHHELVPPLVRRLGIGRHYQPGILDLRASGSVACGDDRWDLLEARGVLGHLHGKHDRTRRWAWAHCSDFESEDAVFEGLSVVLGTGRLHTPPLTTMVLHLGGRTYRFSRTRDLVLRTRSRFGGNRWTFHASRDGVQLAGELELDPQRAALVRYADPEGNDRWCRNSKLAFIRLTLTDPARDLRITLVSHDAAFELASRVRPEGTLIAG